MKRKLFSHSISLIFFLCSFIAQATTWDTDYIQTLEKIGYIVTPNQAPTCFICHADGDPDEEKINICVGSLALAGMRIIHDRPTIPFF
jgi:hypothetical protein